MRVYFTILTLLVFLVLRIPGIYEKVDFEIQSSNNAGAASGAAMILAGAMTLSVQFWAGPSHVMNGGINYADAWHPVLQIVGWVLVFSGTCLLARAEWLRDGKSTQAEELLAFET